MEVGCTGKTGYLSWEAARRVMTRNHFRPDGRGGALTIYRCRHCGYWHLGKSAFEKVKKR